MYFLCFSLNQFSYKTNTLLIKRLFIYLPFFGSVFNDVNDSMLMLLLIKIHVMVLKMALWIWVVDNDIYFNDFFYR